MKATFEHSEDTASNIKTFWFKPEKAMRYVAGQFTELYLPHDHADKRGEKHWFTISSSPAQGLISITSKFAIDRSSTFKQVLWSLQPGDEVTLADPMGDFVLPKNPAIPLLFAASGIGVTPVHSMVQYLQDTKEQRDITLLYGVRHAEDLAFSGLFSTVPRLHFTPIVKQPTADWQGETGSLDSTRILTSLSNKEGTLIYLSGPEFWVEKTVAELSKAGVPTENLITDYFHGYTQV
ncbi:MAG TPA: FAD-dependent oxidoreductase [Candidatus Saccharimonadales bacterium]|nr:FAD-dependent oxidoreductase [Candidatus Saccharimonadales bacterium]